MSRAEFSTKTKLAAWERANGMCEGALFAHSHCFGERCNAPLLYGNFHYDHIDPTWTSGRNDLDNCQVLCVPCHKAKTAKDVRDIAKVKRIMSKRVKAKSSRRPMPFGRDSSLKRKIDGRVVPR